MELFVLFVWTLVLCPGGTDLERGSGDVQPWRPPFSGLSCSSQGSHFKQKSQFTRPLLRKFGNFSLYSLNFHPNFSSHAPKFGNFQLTSPPIRKFSVHKPPPPPFQRQISVPKPHTLEFRAAHHYLKNSRILEWMWHHCIFYVLGTGVETCVLLPVHRKIHAPIGLSSVPKTKLWVYEKRLSKGVVTKIWLDLRTLNQG